MGEPWAWAKSPHTPGEIRLRAAGSQGEPGAWLDRLRPSLREGRAGRPRPLGVPDAAQRLALRKHLGPLADESLPLDSLPSAPGNQRTRQEQRRGCFPKANNQQFCFFFFHPSGRSGRFGIRAAPGLRRVPPRRPRGAGPGRMRGPGRRRPRPPAQPRSGRSPWQRARRGGAGRRGPRRLLFLPLPVPRGHVAMATMLLTAAASRHGWRA